MRLRVPVKRLKLSSLLCFTIKFTTIIILSLIMIGCKDKKEEDVDCYPKTVYVDNRGNKATMLNDSILVVCTCLEYPEKYKMEVINIKNK